MKSLRHFILLSFILGLSASLYGHHFKGLPHFSYFENYPQIPVDEYIGQCDSYEFSLVIYDFQGINKLDAQQPDDVRLFLVIFNLLENKTYQGPVTLKVMDGETEVQSEYFPNSVEESIYTLQRNLSETGDFSLKVILHDPAGKLEGTIPFLLSNQKINWALWISGSLCLIIVCVAYGSRQARLKQDRKENHQAQILKPRD
ncbi:hypothetical protein PQO03_11085 [Lentisphaera profundi]|uniref:Uncharacterized protein n=1 Tax=Lentisphaera profundi TaxID=1658616 RepID=A0ABY7VTV0_9BACT|nr:hypothetical protein [Lentisphaera profundi]WDE96251.1 hypothetical protein PQO03_11085 [Lentisphaera profundi]